MQINKDADSRPRSGTFPAQRGRQRKNWKTESGCAEVGNNYRPRLWLQKKRRRQTWITSSSNLPKKKTRVRLRWQLRRQQLLLPLLSRVVLRVNPLRTRSWLCQKQSETNGAVSNAFGMTVKQMRHNAPALVVHTVREAPSPTVSDCSNDWWNWNITCGVSRG